MQVSTARKLAQIPDDYLIAGVDPHKRMHATVLMTQDAKIRAKLKIGNTRQDFEALLRRAQGERAKVGANGVIFAIEAGSHYWRNLAYYLHEQGLPFRLINPFTLKRQREGEDLDRRKNDYRDAAYAAELLRTGKFTETQLLEGDYAELRAMHQCYRRLRRDYSRNTNRLRALLDGLFPEFCRAFKDPSGDTTVAVLRSCPTPDMIASQTGKQFIAVVRTAFQGNRLAVKKLRALHEAAGTSVGVKAGAKAVAEEIRLLVERQQLLGRHIEEQETKLREMLLRFPESRYLLSVPGLGALIAAGLLAEIGPADNYADGDDLVKLAGTNPIENESGGKSQRHTPMSKKGRAELRCVLWQGALALLRTNEDFRAWARRLENRSAKDHPLKHREVLGAAMNKLLRLYFALVSKKQMYRRTEAGGVAVAA